MTQAFTLDSGKQTNPLYEKLRHRFSYGEDHRTVGEYMMNLALKQDRASSVAGQCPTAEYHVLHGNSLPRSKSNARHENARKKKNKTAKSVLFLTVLCCILLAGIVYTMIYNMQLQRQMERLEGVYENILGSAGSGNVIGGNLQLGGNVNESDMFLILPEDRVL